MTAKQLEQETGCKIMVRGKGSMRDKKKVCIYLRLPCARRFMYSVLYIDLETRSLFVRLYPMDVILGKPRRILTASFLNLRRRSDSIFKALSDATNWECTLDSLLANLLSIVVSVIRAFSAMSFH